MKDKLKRSVDVGDTFWAIERPSIVPIPSNLSQASGDREAEERTAGTHFIIV